MSNNKGDGHDTIQLSHADADDGDWAEVVPETVGTLQEYLGTDEFAVVSEEEQPWEVLRILIDNLVVEEKRQVDNGYFLALGRFDSVPAVLFHGGLSAVYVARKDEWAVRDALSMEVLTFGEDLVSLPESPPADTTEALGMYELRLWVPKRRKGTHARRLARAFLGHRPIYLGDRDAVWVPAESETEIFSRLDSYFERLAICMSDGGLSEVEALAVASRHLSPAFPDATRNG